MLPIQLIWLAIVLLCWQFMVIFFLPGLKFHLPSALWQQGLFQCAALWDFRNLEKNAA